MNKLVENMLDLVHKKDASIHRSIALNAIHYNLGCFASAKRIKFMVGHDEIFVNYFGMTLAGSGTGKDRSDSLVKSLMVDAGEAYQLKLETEFAAFNSKLGPKDVPVPMPAFEFEKATPEGFLQTRVNIDVVGFGIMNLKIPELQNDLGKESTDFFSDIVKCWETGETGMKANRGAPIPGVKDQPTNILIYGSPVGLDHKSKKGSDLLQKLTSGLARRSFLAYPSKKETNELLRANIESKFVPEDISTESKLMNSRILDIIMQDHDVMEMSDDAYDLYLDYDRQMKIKSLAIAENDEAIIAELRSRAWKMVRLAALYAWASMDGEITRKDVEDAIEFTDECGVQSIDLLREKAAQEIIIEFLDASSLPLSREQLMKVALGTTKIAEFNDAMSLANELAEENNQVIEITEGSIPKYRLVQLSGVKLDKLSLSIGKHMSEGWTPAEGPFENLPNVLKSDLWYSAGTFKGGHRTNDNYEQKQDIMIFDIDEDMTLDTAKAFFSEFKCIIATTRNHQKEKHPGTGDIWDRFRIILIPDSTIELDPEAYSKFMLSAMDIMGLPADRKAIDPARFFFGYKDAEVWTSPGDKLFPVKACLPSTSKAEVVHKRLEKYDSVDGIQRWFIASTDQGDRNNKLWRYACVLKDDGYNDDDIESMVIDLNDKIADPLTERELRGTILKSIRRKK